jgi:hypothetical protein
VRTPAGALRVPVEHVGLVVGTETGGTVPVRRVYDQPGGADRLLVDSTGIQHMWVNGVTLRRDGEGLADARRGQLRCRWTGAPAT